MTYFTPLRRKLGIATLLTACMFMAAWVRSRTTSDSLYCTSDLAERVVSSRDGALWLFITVPSNGARPWLHTSSDLSKRPGHRIDENGNRESVDLWVNSKVEWRWDALGFHFGTATRVFKTIEGFVIPYWVLVIPLTLHSGYLLLSKTRAKVESADG